MKKIQRYIIFLTVITIITLIFIITLNSYDLWGLITLIIMILTMGIMYYKFENGNITSKEISLIAILSGFSSVSRIPFAAVPSIQPCTYIIICSGYVFGPVAGFMVGSTTALISNMFLGHGPWTLFQMFGWGLAGATASILQKFHIKNTGLILFGVIWGYLFGWIMNLWNWFAYIYPHTMQTFVFVMMSSAWFDTLHAIGNALFLIFLGEKTITILKRYKDRFHIEYKETTKTTIQPRHQALDTVQ